jgi:shikimate kinase
MVVLVGFMGAGKTTVGRLLAGRLGLPFVDSDQLIEQRQGRTIREIFAADGEPAFRELEHRTVAELVRGPDTVLALGGGAVVDPRTRAELRAVPVVYLKVGYRQAIQRVGGDGKRPMLARADLADLFAARVAVYQEVATLSVDTDGRRPDAVADDIQVGLAHLQSAR